MHADADRCTCLNLEQAHFSDGSVKPHANEWEKGPYVHDTDKFCHYMKEWLEVKAGYELCEIQIPMIPVSGELLIFNYLFRMIDAL